MRNLLTFLAVALVALLTAALVAPLLIDWNSQRGRLQSALSQRLGTAIEIHGPVEARLLPTPYLTLGDVKIGRPGEPIDLTAKAMRFEMGLAGLFGGQLRFTEVHFEAPVATLTLSPEGALLSGLKPGTALIDLIDRISLEQFRVDGGRLTLARGSDSITFNGVDFDLSARSLRGPFRASGAVTGSDGRKIDFQFVANELADSALPLKLELSEKAGARASFDGRIRFPSEGRAPPEFTGAASFSGTLTGAETPMPWRISGALHATPRTASLDNLSARLGTDTRAVEGTGDLKVTFGPKAPQIEATLAAKQLNIDSLLRHDGETSAPPERLLRTLAGFAGAFGGQPAGVDVQVDLSAPTAFLGAQTVDNLDLAVGWTRERGLLIDGGATLPGRTHLRLAGGVEFGSAAAFRGRLESEVQDASALAAWATQGDDALASRFAIIADSFAGGGLAAKADVEASSAGFSARNLALTVGRSNFTGAVAMLAQDATRRGRFYANLHSELLDIDSAPNLVTGGEWFGDLDFVLAVDAAKLHIAQVGLAAVDGGSLSLEASKTGDKLSLDKLSLADLGGASVEAQGEATADREWLRVKLNAQRLKSFAELLTRIAPGRYARLFLDRADALSPAQATFDARREGVALDADFPLDFLTVEGEAAQNHFSLKVSNAPAPVDSIQADLALDAPDGTALLRALGMKSALGSSGHAKLSASATGKWGPGFDTKGSLAFAGAEVAWRGRLAPSALETEPLAFGSATLKSDNLFVPAAAFGLSPATPGLVAPADLTADFTWRPEAASAPRLVGTLAGAKVVGKLDWHAPAVQASAADPAVALATAATGEAEPPAAITGELSFDRGSAAALFNLELGAHQPAAPGAAWSDGRFGVPELRPPSTDVLLRFGVLDLWDGWQASSASARLRMDAGKMELQNVSMQGPAGRVEGHVSLRRAGELAAVNGHVAFSDLLIDKPAMKGHLGAEFDFAGDGHSPLAVVSGLVADGKVRISGASAPKLDPGALGRVIAKAQEQDAAPDETNVVHWFAGELDKQGLSLPDGETPAAINNGVVRAGPVEVPGPTGRAVISTDFDLRSLDFTMRAQFIQAGGGKFWTGSPPAALVTVQNGFDAPTRRIDATLLTAGLATQALAREADRIANLEADLRERAYFSRRLRAERFLRERDAEIAAYDSEQARQRIDQERRRVEEARLAAYEARVKADDDAARAAEKKAEDEQERARAARTTVEAPGAAAGPPTPLTAPSLQDGAAAKSAAPDPAANGIY